MISTVVVVTGSCEPSGDKITPVVFSHMPTRYEFFDHFQDFEGMRDEEIEEAEDFDYKTDNFAFVRPDPKRILYPDRKIGEGGIQIGNIFFEVHVCGVKEAR